MTDSGATGLSRRTGAGATDYDTPQIDAAISAAERDAIVVWRGQRIRFADLPDRIASTDGRQERDGLYAGWIDALEALNPHYRARHAAWWERVVAAGGDDLASTAAGVDVQALNLQLERFSILSETVYYAALRRYLALIGIEQGDATLADVWHVLRGSSWSHWFGERDLVRAASEAGRDASGIRHGDGWRSGEAGLAGGDQADLGPAAAVAELYGSLVGDPAWLEQGLGMASDEIAPFADFVAFVRLYRLRRSMSLLQYEMRLMTTHEEPLQRAYFSGIVGHTTGVSVPEAAYLHEIGRPFSSVADLERSILAGAMAERLDGRYGSGWWADDEARRWTQELAAAPAVEDALAQLGYDAYDWRPVLRQIRTRLIGEMSGYGGPNITTRAGTRKL
jgi:hypothetical protein